MDPAAEPEVDLLDLLRGVPCYFRKAKPGDPTRCQHDVPMAEVCPACRPPNFPAPEPAHTPGCTGYCSLCWTDGRPADAGEVE